MTRWRLTDRRWKVWLALLSLLAVLVTGYEAFHGLPRAWGDTTGRLGIDFDRLAPGRARLTAVEPWSPLAEAGVQAGDTLVAERWYDLERRLRPGEPVAFGVEHGGGRRRVVVQAVAGPHPSMAYRMFVLVHAVTCAAGIAFGALVGWRRASSSSGRSLSTALIVSSINLYPGASPPGWPQVIEQLLFSLALAPAWYALARFAVLFPDDRPTGLRERMQRGLPWLGGIGLVVVAITALRGLGVDDRLHVPAVTAYSALAGAVVILSFLEGWRRNLGAHRMRYGWLLATFALAVIPSLLPALPEWLGWKGAGWLFLAMSVSSLLSYAGLAYAVLRHRVLDLGVVLDRSLAIAVAGVLTFGALKLIELTLAQLARPADPLLAALLGAGLAVTGFVAFQRLRPRAAAWLDRRLFPGWTARAAALQRFAQEAGQARDPGLLAAGFVEAVKSFNLGGGAAVYSEREAGRFALMASSLDAAPPSLDAHQAPIGPLRTQGSAPLAPEPDGRTSDPLALPMCRRAGAGLVLVVALRPGDDAWHDDDLRVIGEVALAVGADLLWLELQQARMPGRSPDGAPPSIDACVGAAHDAAGGAAVPLRPEP